MKEELKNTIKQEVEKLPKENQEAINSIDWATLTEQIGKKSLLTDDEVNDLQVETLLILTGLENPEVYSINIEDEVGTTKEEAEKISAEIGEKIFTPINDVLLQKLKSGERVKKAGPMANINFIVSGGDYSSFASADEDQNTENSAGVMEKPTGRPIKMDDIKSKFTI